MPQISVLGRNFPPLALSVKCPPDLYMITLSQYDPELSKFGDWPLLEALDRRANVTELITIDGRMLNQPKELIALERSRLRLVVTEGAGNNALRATGMLLVNMPAVLVHPAPVPHVFQLHAGNVVPTTVNKRINALANQRNTTPPALIQDAIAEVNRLRPDSAV